MAFEEKSELDSPSSNTTSQVNMADRIKMLLENLMANENATTAQICRFILIYHLNLN